MLDIETSYPYDHINASDKRNLYMYSSYNGVEFIEEYFKSREEVLKRIDMKEALEPQKGKHPVLSLEHQILNTEECINSLLQADLQQEDSKYCLDFFLKKFEVAHRILCHYDKEKTTLKQEISLLSYMKLSYLFSEYIKANFSLKNLNFLLKLNDKVIYLLRNQGWDIAQGNGYISSALESEINLVKDLFKQCQK